MLVRGIDLANLFTGHMSWRRFGVLLQHLPPDSAFGTAIRDASDVDWDSIPEPVGDGPWSKSEMLAAGALDILRLWRWEQSDRKAPAPEPIPRPGIKPRSKVTAISPAVAEYLNEKARLHGAAPSPEWMREHGLA